MATLLSTIVFGQVRATNASHIHKCLGTLLSYKWKTLRLIVNINIKTERTICQSECIKNIYFCYLQKKKKNSNNNNGSSGSKKYNMEKKIKTLIK